MSETRWWKYLQGLMGSQSQLEAARFIGISKSNLTRWKDGARAAPDFVLKVARAYGVNVLEALVEAEFITEEEAALTQVEPQLDLSKVPLSLMLDEFDNRLEVLRYLNSLDNAPKREITVESIVSELAARRTEDTQPKDATPVKPDLHAVKEKNGIPYTDDGEPDYDAIVDGINAGTEKFAAQRATEPLEEHWT